ncbi:MAG: hypothetical protein IRY94_17775, partial [Rhodospirillaceae bacterium]|nr:hypothetical protein [Rhodospirillaceae bacterium]
PVCTVLAAASTAAEVRALAEARVAEVLARLRPQGRPEQRPGADDTALRPAS